MTAVADRDLCPDLDVFVDGMRRSLGVLTQSDRISSLPDALSIMHALPSGRLMQAGAVLLRYQPDKAAGTDFAHGQTGGSDHSFEAPPPSSTTSPSNPTRIGGASAGSTPHLETIAGDDDVDPMAPVVEQEPEGGQLVGKRGSSHSTPPRASTPP